MFNGLAVLSLIALAPSIGLSVWQIRTGAYVVNFRQPEMGVNGIGLPDPWVFPVDFAILPTIWLINWGFRRVRRPVQPGVCRKCGYNLTGNVSGVCPECGTVIGKVVQAK
jgi:hypothetical protein